ncbi:hypothetical protein J4204_03625 [Candidatus Woesearchaeota archaeon]|nr:hypothetical protein [Candidatus Woesearchaeota archaeon]
MKITISLPSDIIKAGKELAKSRGATFSGMIRLSLEKGLKENGKVE